MEIPLLKNLNFVFRRLNHRNQCEWWIDCNIQTRYTFFLAEINHCTSQYPHLKWNKLGRLSFPCHCNRIQASLGSRIRRDERLNFYILQYLRRCWKSNVLRILNWISRNFCWLICFFPGFPRGFLWIFHRTVSNIQGCWIARIWCWIVCNRHSSKFRSRNLQFTVKNHWIYFSKC